MKKFKDSVVKERFSDAQVGDKVYSRLHGLGKVVEVGIGYVIIRFTKDSSRTRSYEISGRYASIHEEAILYYVSPDGTNIYLTKRPKPKLDWSKVPVDTKVHAWIGGQFKHRHFAGIVQNSNIYVYTDGCTSWSAKETITVTTYSLAEDVTIDGVLFKAEVV